MRKISINVDFENLTEGDYSEIEEAVATELQINGFDLQYGLTKTGLMCESILDSLSEL